MKKLLISSFALTALLACAASGPVERTARADAELVDELDGRVAGDPVSCVSQREVSGHEAVGNGLILFKGKGQVDYLNHPQGGCPTLNYGRTLVFRTTSTRLCSGEVASVVEAVSGGSYGSCILGDFTPYARAD